MALSPPVVVSPLHACARAVHVAGTIPEADVEVAVDGDRAGSATAPGAAGVTVEIDVALAEGASVTATQAIDTQTSDPAEPVGVLAAPELRRPRVLGPVVYGVSELALSGVIPGSHVQVHSIDRVIGEAHAPEPLVRVPVRTIQAPVRVTAELCGQTVSSTTVEPLPNPGARAKFGVLEQPVDFGTFAPATLDDPGMPDLPPQDGADLTQTPLRGRLFRPLPRRRTDLPPIEDRPLVVIAHGFHPEDWAWWEDEEIEPSLEGFGWLGSHLASWGMFVCSIDLAAVNSALRRVGSGHYAALQRLRGEVILEMLDRLVDDLEPQGVISRNRIGLVGHSVGGEGVVIARALERERRIGRLVTPYDIRGVVAIAPESHSDHVPTHTAYLQVHSPDDWVMSRKAKSLYDPAWRPRTHVWIDGAGHDEWNSVWRDHGVAPPGEIDPGQQEQIGRRLITAFFLDTLLDERAYRGLLTGQVPLPRHPEIPVRLQHESPSVVVVDDFGDGSPQLGLDPEDPGDASRNRLGGEADATGFDHAELVDHADLPFSDHHTRSLDLAWSARGGRYETALGGLTVGLGATLSLRLAQHYDEVDGEPDGTWNPRGAERDLLVELEDGSTTATVRLGASESIEYPFEGSYSSALLRTVRLPLEAFLTVEPDLDLTRLERLRLRTDLSPTGRVIVDDIELETPLVAGPSLVRMLRVHRLGGGYGPADDHLDAEAVVTLDDHPDEAFGLTLRRGAGLAAAEATLHALRAAITSDAPVRVVYSPQGARSRRIVRVVGQR